MIDDIKESKLTCSKCGYVLVWKPTIWAYIPHEPKPLVCPKCGGVEWDDDQEE
jgi:ribosomal protein S27AE